MSIKAALLFSGQGAQKVGMAKDLAEAYPSVAQMLNHADEAVGFELSKVMFDGPADELTRTSRCQPALLAHGLAVWSVLKEKVPQLEVVAAAGLSLGEFTAHAAAGTFDFATAIRLVCQRGQFMEEACNETKGSMAAMIGGEESAVRELAAECEIDVANLNAPGQIVVSGSAEGVAKAVEGAKAKGIVKAIPLQVAGAYHSRLMKSAQDKLAAVLDAAAIGTPTVPVYCNYAARAVADASDVRSMLVQQVTGSVRWAESLSRMIADGCQLFIECGMQAQLAGMMKRIDKTAKVISIEDVASLDKAVGELSAM
ncbi:MAG: ACP S-malonyltransferase [Verrucomicrobiaceae bacterium]|nr:ACP S-malonyltransferase [Verrucomicrobiaceae bacterium]